MRSMDGISESLRMFHFDLGTLLSSLCLPYFVPGSPFQSLSAGLANFKVPSSLPIPPSPLIRPHILSIAIKNYLTMPRDLSELHALNDTICSSLPASARNRHLVEIYVLAEANWLRSQPGVAKAIAERGLQIHAFVFDKEKETCVQIVESGEKSCDKPAEKSVNGEIINAAAARHGEGGVMGDVQALREIDLTSRANGTVNRSVNGNGKVNGARNLKEEKKCDGACGGKGLCKGTGEYAF
jgi:hypothetical protein